MACIKCSFPNSYSWLENSSAHVYTLVDGHLVPFQCLAVTKLLWTWASSGQALMDTGLISVVETESPNAYCVVLWGKLPNCFQCGWVLYILLALFWLLHILIISHTLRFSSFWHDLARMLTLIFIFFMIDNTENLSFFSFVSIFGELYTNVLPILWLINEFECPLSVNNLDMFSQGATYLFHLNKFSPK